MLKNGMLAGSLRQLLRALLVWILSALLLTLLSALILSKTGTGSAVLGYLSSALSFLAALAAGFSSGGKKGSAFLFPALLTAGFLILILLTAGCIAGEALNPSAVLSVVSFTLTGVLLGSLIARGRRAASPRRSFRGKSSFRSRSGR